MNLTPVQERVLREIGVLDDEAPVTVAAPLEPRLAMMRRQAVYMAAMRRPKPKPSAARAYIAVCRRVPYKLGIDPNPADVLDVVCDLCRVRQGTLQRGVRTESASMARAVACYYLKAVMRLSYPAIGRLLGDRTHSTAISACRRMERLLGGGRRAA